MKHTAQDILNYVEDNDVKFVRLAFCDIFGNQKNISVFAGDLPYAFEQGVCFDGSSIAGFMNTEESDTDLPYIFFTRPIGTMPLRKPGI